MLAISTFYLRFSVNGAQLDVLLAVEGGECMLGFPYAICLTQKRNTRLLGIDGSSVSMLLSTHNRCALINRQGWHTHSQTTLSVWMIHPSRFDVLHAK